MLEIKNLNKTYYPKAGSKVNALNNINLKIQEKGLIFILGKSGSGKSTLLNLLGGLDQYDSGNIIIKGRSTKDFKQKDFDAYRNTSVGFVFQEYNLLDDFTVGANIALAIELQGRKSTNEEINAILKEVDLEGYGKRKTNELSGGQKQRVAIARALVKHPEIILADEPTGALDSKTGLQIFDILKRLAKDKLVLVVSHDREFAESYGDRVIELSDGKIIGDITKVKNQSDKFIEQLNYSENEGFVVSEEYVLTQADLKQINDYLDKNKKLQITKKAIDEINVLEEFVETNEDLELKKYDGFNMLKSKIPFQVAFKMGASALNHKKIRLVFTILLSMVAFVLFGVSDTLGSYNKVTAFTNSIMENNIETVVFSKEKEFERTSNNSSWFDYNTVQMNDNDLEKLEYLTGLKLKPVYSEGGNVAVNSYPYEYALSTNRDSNYSNFQRFYSFAVKGFTEINMDEIKKLGFTLHGKLPENDNEIVITNYTYEHFKNFKHKDQDGNISFANNYSQLIGKNINFYNKINGRRGYDFVITGILDTNFDSSKFEELKDNNNHKGINYELENELMLLLNYTYNNLAFLNEGLIDKMVIKDNNEFLNRKSRYSLSVESEDYSGNAKVYSEQDDGIVLFDKNKTKLAPDEVIITLDQYAKIDNKTYTFKNMTNYYSSFKQYEKDIDSIKETYFLDNYLDSFERYIQDFRLESHHPSMQISHMRDYFTKGKGREETVYFNRTSVEVYNDAFKLNMKELESNEGSLELNLENANSNLLADKLYNFSYQNYEEAVNNGFLEEIELINPKVNEIIIAYANYLHRAYRYKESYVSKSLSEIRYDLRVDFVNANKELFNNLVVKTKYSGYDLDEDFVSYIKGELKIVGFNIKTASDYDKGMVYLSEEEFKALKDTDKNYPYTFVLGSMPESKKEVTNLVKLNDQSFNGSYYRLENEITPTINYANDIVEMIANIFIYIGLGFALFAGLMLSNFIGTSVARKKKEIGILRALGASSFDVYEIFLYESLLIAFINFLLAVIGTLIAVIILNSTMKNDFGLNLKIFNFGFRQIIILLFISLFVALVASFLPVYKIARKRPVDAISNK